MTDVVADGGDVFACSQAGVQAGATWFRPTFRPTCLAVQDDMVLVGGGVPAESGSVALYSRAGTKRAERRVSDDLVYSVAIRWDGAAAAVGCADGSVRIVSLPGLRVLEDKTKHTAPCRVVRYSKPFLATGGLDGLVYRHDHRTNEEVVFKDHTAGVECLLFHEGRVYSGARDGKVRIHETRLVRSYQGMREPVLGLAVRDGVVFAGIRDGRVFRLSAKDATYSAFATIETPLFTMTNAGGRLLAGTSTGTRDVLDR